ncbi:unnamed protein product [Schistosoma mattheei]|uniref:Uncharacterized protein n=1 Tax=Schistosoma mattheei TaxID=31246 RepID=A0A183P041_9TREM|nr:unnamed protein product [Schistosoma mattheei]
MTDVPGYNFKEVLKKLMKKEQELKKLEVKAINQDQIEREKILAENNRELLKLRCVEKEYQEFQHQIYANSPPASTQLPKEIHEKVTQTPKSPALSLKLDNLNQECEFPLLKKLSPFTMNTPTIQNLQTLDKVTNIRKTPRKTGRQITEEFYKVDTEKSWFDCEQIFGYGAED